MPKLKSHSGLAKRAKQRPGGTVKISQAGNQHNTGKKSSSKNRKLRKSTLMSKDDVKRLKTLIK